MAPFKMCSMKLSPASDYGCALGFFCAASCLLHGSLSIKQEEAREKERGSNAPVCLCDVARSTHIQFQEVGITSECKARCHQDVAWKS